jgi:hypothetical protein
VDSQNPASLGRRNIQRHLAGFERQQVIVARNQIPRSDQQFQYENIATGARPATLPAFRILRHADDDGVHDSGFVKKACILRAHPYNARL